jgi:hypothetical protein
MPRLAKELGMDLLRGVYNIDEYLPYFERMRAEGAVVLLKIDGPRGPGDNGPYTAMVKGGRLGEEVFFRIDSRVFVEAAAYITVEYARACWKFTG